MTPNRTYRLPVLFIALSFAAGLLEFHLLSKTEPYLSLLDPLSLGLNAVWLALLGAIAWYAYRGSATARTILLVLACLIVLLSCIGLLDDDVSLAVFAVGVAEGLLLFAAYRAIPYIAPVEGAATVRPRWSVWRVMVYLVVGLFASVGMFVGVVVAAAFWWMTWGVFGLESFDREAWSKPAAQAEDSCHRGAMASDIKKHQLKPGMAKADVERLLGQPDNVSDPRRHQYILGMCSGFRTSQDSLDIYFDEQGAFERAAIISTEVPVK